jgi:hypothetical protein
MNSHYIRISLLLSSKTILNLHNSCRIRFLDSNEASKIAEQARKYNVFARHSGEENFYLKRLNELGNNTIIEILRAGSPKDLYSDLAKTADLIEKVAVISTTFAMKKDKLLNKIGINKKPRREFDFVIGPQYRSLKTRTISSPRSLGIHVDERFNNRFSRCGFNEMIDHFQMRSSMSERALASFNWLFESRVESQFPASVVKTSITLETLLIISDSESLSQSLSERSAFILSTDPFERQRISKIIKRFYEGRSGIVHGSKKKVKKMTPMLLEGVDRITLLILLIFSANPTLWLTKEDLYSWFEIQRWGAPSNNLAIPYPKSYLQYALRLCE